jgi:hypothetical protein
LPHFLLVTPGQDGESLNSKREEKEGEKTGRSEGPRARTSRAPFFAFSGRGDPLRRPSARPPGGPARRSPARAARSRSPPHSPATSSSRLRGSSRRRRRRLRRRTPRRRAPTTHSLSRASVLTRRAPFPALSPPPSLPRGASARRR